MRLVSQDRTTKKWKKNNKNITPKHKNKLMQ